jgi:LemA protein
VGRVAPERSTPVPWWWIAGAVAVLLAGYAAWTYNRLVGLAKRADGAWSDIDVQLKRRWDLVPALVETVKGYAAHESGTLQAVVAARAEAERAGSVARRGESERGLAAAVGQIFALAEAYPDLKANASYLDLQKNLVAVEDAVQYARRYYNAVVRDYNTLVASVPPALVARPLGFAEREFFQLDAAERTTPQVQL